MGSIFVMRNLTSKKLIGTGKARNEVYYLKPSAGGTVFTTIHAKQVILWHQRLGHLSFGSLSSLLVSCDFHLNKEQLGCYDVCHRTKQTRSPFTVSTHKAERPLSLIHCDLWGQYHTPSLGVVIITCALQMNLVGLYGYSFSKKKLRLTIQW